MGVSLLHTSIDPSTGRAIEDALDRNSQAIIGIVGPNAGGAVELAEGTVNAIAELLENAPLSNGELVTAYTADPDSDYDMGAFVPDFGPVLLSEETRAELRALIAADKHGLRAAALVDLIVERWMRVSFTGKKAGRAQMQAVNWPADMVEINRTSFNMATMFRTLGLGDTDRDTNSELVALPVFKKAVEVRGIYTDMPERLQAFIACAERNRATHVYWA